MASPWMCVAAWSPCRMYPFTVFTETRHGNHGNQVWIPLQLGLDTMATRSGNPGNRQPYLDTMATMHGYHGNHVWIP